MPELIQFTVSPHSDPVGLATRAILQAHFSHERSKARRQFWVNLLAAVGGVVILCLMFPQAASAQLRDVLVALWVACCVCVMTALALEWRWRRREAHVLAANRTIPEPDNGP